MIIFVRVSVLHVIIHHLDGEHEVEPVVGALDVHHGEHHHPRHGAAPLVHEGHRVRDAGGEVGPDLLSHLTTLSLLIMTQVIFSTDPVGVVHQHHLLVPDL